MSRFLLVLMVVTLALMTGCGGAVEMDAGDKDALDKLSSLKPAPKADGNGYVVEMKLEGKRVKDQAMDHVIRLMDLQKLSLFDSSISDKGLEKLRSLEKLDSLGIANTRISDKGLLVLQKMKALRHVWLTEKNFSSGAVNELKKANPNLAVHFQ